MLNAAIRKHGFASFRWEILATLSSFKEMMDEEVRLIAKLRPEYNITRGGQGIIGLVRTAAWRDNISTALKGRKPTPQCYAAHDPTALFKSIVCLNDGAFFAGIKLASEHYGITTNSIGEMLHGRQFKCGKNNLSFVFSDAPIEMAKCSEMLNDLMLRRFDRASARKSRAVVCLSTGVDYKNAVTAARDNGISPARVMQLCQNGGATARGLSFRYADSPAVVKRERTQEERDAQRRGNLAGLRLAQIKTRKRVILVESGEIFDSVAEAARRYRFNEKNLYACIEFGRDYWGYTFRLLADDGNPIIVEGRKRQRKVICLDDMVVSAGINTAVKRYGINRSKLTGLCESGSDQELGGRRFSFLDQWCGNAA